LKSRRARTGAVVKACLTASKAYCTMVDHMKGTPFYNNSVRGRLMIP
jgi:hypothetical protein